MTARRIMIALRAAALCAAAIPSALAAQPAMARAERALNGPPAPYVHPGPADARIAVGGPIIIHILPAWQVRRYCPAGFDWHSMACTLMPGRVIYMPDEDSSGLTTDQWLEELRHEILHTQGLTFDRADR